MQRMLLKSKIAGGRVTSKRLEYSGSLTVDSAILKAADIEPFEQIHVLNLSNGARLTTYAIEGGAGSGTMELNGPAARLGEPGDEITVLAYGVFSGGERRPPLVLRLTAGNRPAKTSGRRRTRANRARAR